MTQLRALLPDARTLGWQLVTLLVLLAMWEAFGVFVDDDWTSRPSLIFVRLATMIGGDLWRHAATTAIEMAAGLAIGVPAGILAGIVLGHAPLAASLLRPAIVALYSVPLITLAPLLIYWFGLGMAPKVVLVTCVVFFLIFFNTFSGVQAIDRDQIASLVLMGATEREQFRKLVLPGCMTWIMSGLKTALPYSLIAATTCEMLLAREGLGYLLMNSAGQIDMTGLYATLVVLMAMGVAIGQCAISLERRMLRWRTAS